MTPFEILEYPNGTSTVLDTVSGEVMHSRIGPWEEAQTLYIQQSRLTERLQALGKRSPLVVYDVGMGIAANAWAAIEARLALCASQTTARPLKVISFENELSGLRLALRTPDRFGYLSRAASALETLVETGKWSSSDAEISWELRVGDFFSLARSVDAPEIVFYDFYAPRSCPELWSVRYLTQLHKILVSETLLSPDPLLPCDFYTYSAATPVRVGLLLAGFFVGYGIGTGAKNETTVASLDLNRLENPLSERWLEKFLRSDRPFPWGDPNFTESGLKNTFTEELKRLRSRILDHPQFQKSLASI